MLNAWQMPCYEQAINAFIAGRLGHAQFVQGPAMLGKHDMVQEIAKRVLCKNAAQALTACGQCVSCERFVQNTHGDFMSLDLEINDKTGKLRTALIVDQIRHMNEWLSLTSQLSGAQVVVIKHAHRLNTQAANALLKTLEEPMPNRYIFLVSDNPQFLPATIRSRCQQMLLALPKRADALQFLRAQKISEADAEKLLELAGGNPGLAMYWKQHNGLALYEQVRADLSACMKNQTGAAELSKKWLADEQTELRLVFAVFMAHTLAKQWAVQTDNWAKSNALLAKLQEWIDAMNRLRLSLSQPMRHDLSLTGLFANWRNLLQESRTG